MARLSAQAPSGGGRVTLPGSRSSGREASAPVGRSSLPAGATRLPCTIPMPKPARVRRRGDRGPSRRTEGAGLLAQAGPEVAARVTMHDRLAAALVGAVHVQECAPERIELKRELFESLDELTDPSAVLASSSSALTISSRPRAICTVAPAASSCILRTRLICCRLSSWFRRHSRTRASPTAPSSC